MNMREYSKLHLDTNSIKGTLFLSVSKYLIIIKTKVLLPQAWVTLECSPPSGMGDLRMFSSLRHG
jgi:hypothetical protein